MSKIPEKEYEEIERKTIPRYAVQILPDAFV
jgi:hypothetical protein